MSIDYSAFLNVSASVPAIWHYSTGLVSLLCLLCGLLSNGFLIFIFIRDPNLRRPRNYFIINLAITDLGLLISNNVLHVIASFKKQWIFGQIGCNLYAVCGGVFGLGSIATMAAISITRLVAVINPFSSLKLSGQFTIKCLICSWLYSSVWIMPPLFGWNRFIFEGFGTTCTFDYFSQGYWDRLFIFTLVTGGFLIPLSVIIFSYTFILIKLNGRSRHIMFRNSDEQDLQLQSRQANDYDFQQANSLTDVRCQSEAAIIYEPNENNQITRNVRLTEARARRTALYVCAIFCTAWGPYALMAVSSQFGFDRFINPYTTAMLGLFTKTAACVNPLIYALSSITFRQQICRFVNFMCACRQTTQPLS
ncbi:unnamed protein product [Rotaria sp. Silwood1]|nr:unnamed protein product [Rotaria sp. Silwood1]CAF3838500.1 unnamed protein product [Rotaria sp. Silwood1]CAF4731969.1 unnamed protein product [Rotaria sp. Silwood1]CAF4864509.1 unnamed protein product [Rotaria sp. Silwood1]